MAKNYKTGIIITGNADGAVKATRLTDSSLEKLNKTTKRTAASMSQVAKRTAGWASVAAGAGVAASVVMIKRQLDIIDTTAKTADVIGIATDKLTALELQAELTGASQSVLHKGLRQMTRTVADAANGIGEGVDALEKLGLKAEELQNLSPDQQFAAIGEALQGVENQSQRVAVAYDLFGAKGTALLNTLKGGASAALEAQEFTEQWGLALNRVEANKIEQANDAMTLVSRASEGFWKQLTLEVSPAITGVAKEMLGFGSEAGTAAELAQSAFNKVIKVVGFVADMGRGLQVIWKGLTKIVAEWFAQTWEAVAGADRLITELLNKLPSWLGGGGYTPNAMLQNVAGSLRSSADKLGAELDNLVNRAMPSDLIQSKMDEWKRQAREIGEQAAKNAAAAVSQQVEAVDTSELDSLERQVELLNEGRSIQEAKLLLDEEETRLRLKNAEYTQEQIDRYIELSREVSDYQEAEKRAARAAREAAKEQSSAADQVKNQQKELNGLMRKYLDESLGDGAVDAFDNINSSVAKLISSMEELSEGQRKGAEGFGLIAGTAKGFFSEGSKGYKALEKAETAFRAVQLAESIATTGKLVGNAKLAATANAQSGIAAQSQVPIVGFALAAAMAAMLASYGIDTGGKSSGVADVSGALDNASVGNSIATSGTVLGDPEAASESIVNALDRLEDIASDELGLTQQMLRSLKNIEVGISGVSGIFSQTAQRAGVQTLNLSGTAGNPLVGIVEQFVSGRAFSFERGFYDLTSERDISEIEESAADDIRNGIQSIFSNLGGAINDAVTVLGGDVEAALSQFNDINLGNIEIREGEDLDQTINALFASLGDSAVSIVSETIGAGIERLQLFGEGAAETLFRVASGVDFARNAVEELNIGLADLGTVASGTEDIGAELIRQSVMAAFSGTGIASIISDFVGDAGDMADLAINLFEVRDAMRFMGVEAADVTRSMLDAAGGLDALQSGLSTFRSEFFSAEEQLGFTAAEITEEFDRLGKTLPDTRDGFRSLVEGLNLTQEADQALYGSLLALVPLADEYYDGLESIAAATADAAGATGDLADSTSALAAEQQAVVAERERLERALLQVQGDTAALRALELDGLHESNRALQEHIWALEAEQAASAAAAEAERELAAERERVAQERYSLETQLLQLQGDTAALRARELEQLAPSNRALQELIWALEDQQAASVGAADATQAGADLAAEQARIAQERYNLETQLLQVQGDTAALRARELEQLDPSNRALQELIWQLENQQAASIAAAEAERELAAERERIAQERYSLETELLQLQGDTAALRARELEQLDPSNQALQQHIWALEDQQIAAEKSAEAARQMAAAEEALAAERAKVSRAAYDFDTAFGLNDGLIDLEKAISGVGISIGEVRGVAGRGITALYDWATTLDEAQKAALQPFTSVLKELAQPATDQQIKSLNAAANNFRNARNSVEVEIDPDVAAMLSEREGLQKQLLELEGDTTALRKAERNALHASNRALFDQIKALEDQAAAASRAADATQSVVDEILRLRGIDSPAGNQAGLEAEFKAQLRKARSGDINALGQLPELTRALESAAGNNFGSLLEKRAFSAGLANSLAETLKQQNVLVPQFASGGVHAGGLRLVGENGPELEFTGPSRIYSNPQTEKLLDNSELLAELQALRKEVGELRMQNKAGQLAIAKNTGRSAKLMQRWDFDGMPETREVPA